MIIYQTETVPAMLIISKDINARNVIFSAFEAVFFINRNTAIDRTQHEVKPAIIIHGMITQKLIPSMDINVRTVIFLNVLFFMGFPYFIELFNY